MNINNFLLITDFIEFKNQSKLKLENIEQINLFFNSEYNNKFKPFYHLNPLYNTILNNNQFQYIVINFDNDKVMICYKIIQIMTTKQIRILGVPISINKIKKNIKIVTDHLNELEFVRIVTMNENIFDGELLSEYNDYYYDYSLRSFNGKFRSKHGINKMLNNKDFKIIVENKTSIDFISKLRESWISGMIKNGSIVSDKSTKDFYKIIQYDNNNILNIIITYKSNPISIQTFIISKELKYADCLYINHLGRNESQDENLMLVLKNICDIQNYFAHKELLRYSISDVYIAGCRPTEKRLLKHKEKISDGKIEYYIK